MARTYKRDALGRFAGGGGGGGRPKARPVSRGANRLTRDNAGRITSQGGAGATARGGRLRTASGKQRAVQTARIAGGGGNTIAKGGNGISGRVARSLAAVKRGRVVTAKTGANKGVATQSAGGKPKLKRSGKRIKMFRSTLPKTTLTYKDALPPAPSNAARLQKARDIKQNAVSKGVSFAEMQKLRLRASVAQNPYSNLSKSERTRRINDLAKAELAQRKKDRSYRTAAKAEDIYTNVVGYTQREGRRKWKRAGQRTTSMGAGTIRGGRR